MRIGDLARETQTRVETIRWYEKAGLLPQPPRTSGNYRVYGQAELTRLSFIRRARDLDFSLDQVRALLVLAGNRDEALRFRP
jgi:DNA-binding transcriptional MerR regulator